MMYKATFESPLLWKKLGPILRVEGVLLSEGTFTGLEGKPVHFSADVLQKYGETFLGKPIVYPHTIDEGDEKQLACGFISEVAFDGGSLLFSGYVYDPKVCELIETGKLDAFSAEVEIEERFCPESGWFEAERLRGTAVALTSNPACPECRLLGATPVQLESGASEEEEEVEKVSEETTASAVVTQAEVGTYPLPRPTVVSVAAVDYALKQMGLSDADIQKFWDVISEKYPYPYPTPTATGEASEASEELQKELENLRKERDELLKKYNSILEARKEAYIAEIKKLDKKFDATKLLEGVDDIEMQLKMLESYLESLKRITPAKLELSPEKSVEQQVKKVVEELFGPGFVEV